MCIKALSTVFVLIASSALAGEPAPGCADLDKSGVVSFPDALIFLKQFASRADDIPACATLHAYSFSWTETGPWSGVATFCDDGAVIAFSAADSTIAPVVDIVATAVAYRSSDQCPSQCFYQVAFDEAGNIKAKSATQCLNPPAQ